MGTCTDTHAHTYTLLVLITILKVLNTEAVPHQSDPNKVTGTRQVESVIISIIFNKLM